MRTARKLIVDGIHIRRHTDSAPPKVTTRERKIFEGMHPLKKNPDHEDAEKRKTGIKADSGRKCNAKHVHYSCGESG
ncbi:MAG: hypothetical protein ABH845_04110, partial [Candidatus Omnitrophota bacterium]